MYHMLDTLLTLQEVLLNKKPFRSLPGVCGLIETFCTENLGYKNIGSNSFERQYVDRFDYSTISFNHLLGTVIIEKKATDFVEGLLDRHYSNGSSGMILSIRYRGYSPSLIQGLLFRTRGFNVESIECYVYGDGWTGKKVQTPVRFIPIGVKEDVVIPKNINMIIENELEEESNRFFL